MTYFQDKWDLWFKNLKSKNNDIFKCIDWEIMKKSLKEYTDQELYEELKNNESVSSDTLVWICSEVLRRQIERQEYLRPNS